MIGRNVRNSGRRDNGRCSRPSHAAVCVEVVRLLTALGCMVAYCAVAFVAWVLAVGR
jgi:hypothetical protein